MPHSDYLLEPDDSDDTLDSDESYEAPDRDEGIPVEHFQVVLERAVDHAKSSGCEEVNSADVLVAMLNGSLGDLLNEHGLTRYDATTFISHGIGKDAQTISSRDVVDQPGPHAPSGDATGSPMCKIQLLNDDYTSMDFVVQVLTEIFALAPDDAERVMLEIHHEGAGTCGTFTHEEAEAKVAQVVDLARQHQHPLRCSVQQ
jgi:ATP-dependent Clp protease adaptor protein ClpS